MDSLDEVRFELGEDPAEKLKRPTAMPGTPTVVGGVAVSEPDLS